MKTKVKELTERDFDKIIEIKDNGNVSLFCNEVRNMDNSEMIRFFRYISEHLIQM